MKRWAPLLLALVVTLVAALGVAFGVNRLAGSEGGGTPHLRTVSDGILTAAGLTLGPATVPPYCGVLQGAAGRSGAGVGLAGCPIGREAAEKAATAGAQETVAEAVLATASMPRNPSVGRDRLVWVVVTTTGVTHPMIACPVRPGYQPSFCGRPSSMRVVKLVDARSGQALASVAAGPVAAAAGTPRPLPPLG